MTEPVAMSLQAADAMAAAQAPASPASSSFHPGETRMFANLMQGLPQPPGGVGGAPGALHDAAMAYATQLSGNVRSYEEMRRSMLESIDLSDPIKSMFVLTDHNMQAQMVFAKLHISTGLASAATSLFGSLLKNQQ